MNRNAPPAQSVTVSTATGNFGPAFFGGGFRIASLAYVGGATAQTMVGSVQGSLGNSGVWSNVLVLSTANSTGNVYLASTGQTRVFDKLRLTLSANNRTAATTVWLGVAE
jgi:hypothetical protein